MHDILRNIDSEKQVRKAWIYSLVLSAYITLFMVQGTAGEVNTTSILNTDPVYLLIAQGFFSSIMFIGAALLFARIALKLNPRGFFPKIGIGVFASIIGITLCFMVVNSAIGEWNMNLEFPDSSFSRWAQKTEEQLKILTDHLTHFTSVIHFIIAIVVVAIIPGIGEELLFRGLIQNLFIKAFSNHHVAIWLTGFVFSAIHMQFYGIVPRMLLGVLFGYLYFWSSNLSIAIIAHIINNGLALLLMYLSQNGTIAASPEQMESAAPWPAILVFGIIGAFLLGRFYVKQSKAHE